MYIFAYNKGKDDFGEDLNFWEVLNFDEVIEARWLYVASNVSPCQYNFGEEEGWQTDKWTMPSIRHCRKHHTSDINGKEIDLDTIEYKHEDTWKNKPIEYYNDLENHFENNPYTNIDGESTNDFKLSNSPRYASTKNTKIDRIAPFEPLKLSTGSVDLNDLDFGYKSTRISKSEIAELLKIKAITPSPIRENGGEYALPYSFVRGVHSLTKIVDSTLMEDFLKDFIANQKKGHITVYVTELDIFYEDFISVLDSIGFKYVKEKSPSKLHSKEYNYFISARKTGKSKITYSLNAKVNSKTVIEFIDMNKILNIPKEKLIEDYGENIQTYSFACGHAIFSLNHYITQANGVEKMNKPPTTITSYGKRILQSYGSYNDFTNLYDTKIPENLNIYQYIDNSYHGGFQYFDKEKYDYINKIKRYSGLNTVVLDVNSLYDYAMKYKPLPIGIGHHHKGKPNKYLTQDLKKGLIAMFLRVKVDCKVKKDKVPTLSKPRYNFSDDVSTILNYNMNENYIKDTTGMIEVVLTYPDYLLLKECYDIRDIEFIDYIYFQADIGSYFGKYVDKFYKLKSNSSGAVKRTAKLLLVTPYGWTCKKRTNFNIEGDDVVENSNDYSYLHIGSYISAWSRYKIVMDGLKFKKWWLYSDTDSLHLILDESLSKDLYYNYDEKKPNNNYIFTDKEKLHLLPEKRTKKNYRDNGVPLGSKLGEYKIEKLGYFNYYKNKVYIMNDELGFHITKAGADRYSMDELEKLMNTIKTDIEGELQYGALDWVEDFKKEAKEYYDGDKIADFVINLATAIKKKNLKNLEELNNIPVRIRRKTEPFKYSYGYRYENFVTLVSDEYNYI